MEVAVGALVGLLARVAQRVPAEVALDAGPELALIARVPLLATLLRGMGRLEVSVEQKKDNRRVERMLERSHI